MLLISLRVQLAATRLGISHQYSSGSLPTKTYDETWKPLRMLGSVETRNSDLNDVDRLGITSAG